MSSIQAQFLVPGLVEPSGMMAGGLVLSCFVGETALVESVRGLDYTWPAVEQKSLLMSICRKVDAAAQTVPCVLTTITALHLRAAHTTCTIPQTLNGNSCPRRGRLPSVAQVCFECRHIPTPQSPHMGMACSHP